MVDVIILSNAMTVELCSMTQQAILTCSNSRVSITVIEQSESVKQYFGAEILRINEPFNYNRFANIGAAKGNAEWIMIANNDLIFHPGWLTALLKVNHPVVSPKCPKDRRQKLVTKDTQGYLIGYNFSGWCFMLTRKVWEQIGGFDEDFEFWCADNSFLEQLKPIGVVPMLVVDATVEHLLSRTYRGMPEITGEVLRGQVQKFNLKYGKNVFNYGTGE